MEPYCTESPTSSSPACSIYNLCNNGNPQLSNYMCDTNRVFSSLCLDHPFLGECGRVAAGFSTPAAFKSCLNGKAFSLYSTATVQGIVNAVCGSMGGMTDCQSCTAQACAEPLVSASNLCLDMDMSECAPFWSWCDTEVRSNAGALCLPASERAGGADACIATPASGSCASYTYPDTEAAADIASLCASMPDMPGCSISTSCAAGEVSGPYCANFRILATLCTDMPSMSGCKSYSALCAEGTAVRQCTQQPPIPGTPSWYASRSSVFEACSSHYMDGCSMCTQLKCPDPLDTLSTICASMPDMRECAEYQSWCEAVGPDFKYYCDSSGTGRFLPSMLMYFHSRIEEVVLWRSWLPKTAGQYVGTFIAVLMFGIVSTAVRTLRACLVVHWTHRRNTLGSPVVSSIYAFASNQQAMEAGVKAALSGVSLTLDYFNMLVAMTYNIGLFIAVVLGYVLGALLMSHIPDNYASMLHARAQRDRPSHQPTRESLPR
ncbi:MAG: hypothetical protein WDW36_003758 [Sanguina aurantia]